MARAWLQMGLPSDLCDRYPELAQYGIYRRLNDNGYEVLPYCEQDQSDPKRMVPRVQKYTCFSDDDLKEVLDSLLPKVQGSNGS